jgi:hypothetical protein
MGLLKNLDQWLPKLNKFTVSAPPLSTKILVVKTMNSTYAYQLKAVSGG